MTTATSSRGRAAGPLLLSLAIVACGGGGGGKAAAPTLASVAPTAGLAAGGTGLTLTGTGFSAGATVTLGGIAATGVVVSGASSITATSPAHAEGAVDVVVTSSDGQAATLPGAFTYTAGTPPPTVTSLSLTSGATGGGQTVTISGSGFSVSPAPAVSFGTTPAAVTAGNTAASITVTTPPHGQGLVAVTVKNPDGQTASLTGAFTYNSPAGSPPTIASVLNAATGLPSGSVAGGDTVTVTGTNLSPGAGPSPTVHFGGAAGTVVSATATTITVTTPLNQPSGPVDVTVLLPGSGLAGTLPNGFTFLGPPGPAPKVLAFNIFGAPPSGGTAFLLIIGTNLTQASQVRFGGTLVPLRSGVGGPDQLVVLPPPSTLSDGFVDVVVTNPDGQSDTLAPSVSRDGTPWPANFHYGPPPVVTSFSPTGGKGIPVTLSGTGFTADPTGARAGLQVLMSGPSSIPPLAFSAPAPTPTTITVSVPSKQINQGSYRFVVSNFDGQTTVTTTPAFVVP